MSQLSSINNTYCKSVFNLYPITDLKLLITINLSIMQKIYLVSGQGASKGDSGAGLCFVHSNTYYLTGVVSLKDPNTTNSIAVFTDVKHHIQWICELYSKYN